MHFVTFIPALLGAVLAASGRLNPDPGRDAVSDTAHDIAELHSESIPNQPHPPIARVTTTIPVVTIRSLELLKPPITLSQIFSSYSPIYVYIKVELQAGNTTGTCVGETRKRNRYGTVVMDATCVGPFQIFFSQFSDFRRLFQRMSIYHRIGEDIFAVTTNLPHMDCQVVKEFQRQRVPRNTEFCRQTPSLARNYFLRYVYPERLPGYYKDRHPPPYRSDEPRALTPRDLPGGQTPSQTSNPVYRGNSRIPKIAVSNHNISKRTPKNVQVFISNLEFREDQEGRIQEMKLDLQLDKEKRQCRQLEVPRDPHHSTRIDCRVKEWEVKFHDAGGQRFLDIYYENKEKRFEADASMRIPRVTCVDIQPELKKCKQIEAFMHYLEVKNL